MKKKSHFYNLFFILLAAVIVTGCAVTVPVARQQEQAVALKSSPAEGKALIYVLRKKEFGGCGGYLKLYLNNNYWGELACGLFLAAQVEPGDHVLVGKAIAGMGGPPEPAGQYHLHASSGEKYFFLHHYTGRWPLWEFSSLSNITAENEIKKFKLSAANNLLYTLESGAKNLPQPLKTATAYERKPLSAPIVESATPKPSISIAPLPAPAVPDFKDISSLDFGTYYALVIGNNEYHDIPKLRTAVNDARTMAALFQDKYGFKVRLLLNATRADILRTINGYRRGLGQHDNLLIYYAGHGWLDEDADQGYWLPVDATEQDPTNWISNGSITDALRAMDAKHVLVIADSCYSGKLARGINIRVRTKNYYKKILTKKARTVMASGGLEPVADEGGKGKHSVFASALIEALNENQGVLDATLLFSQIRRPVMVNTDQTPEYSDIRKAGHAGGDFLFVKQKR